MNKFVTLPEIIKGYEDNYKRVVCNWESCLNYNELVEMFL